MLLPRPRCLAFCPALDVSSILKRSLSHDLDDPCSGSAHGGSYSISVATCERGEPFARGFTFTARQGSRYADPRTTTTSPRRRIVFQDANVDVDSTDGAADSRKRPRDAVEQRGTAMARRWRGQPLHNRPRRPKELRASCSRAMRLTGRDLARGLIARRMAWHRREEIRGLDAECHVPSSLYDALSIWPGSLPPASTSAAVKNGPQSPQPPGRARQTDSGRGKAASRTDSQRRSSLRSDRGRAGRPQEHPRAMERRGRGPRRPGGARHLSRAAGGEAQRGRGGLRAAVRAVVRDEPVRDLRRQRPAGADHLPARLGRLRVHCHLRQRAGLRGGSVHVDLWAGERTPRHGAVEVLCGILAG